MYIFKVCCSIIKF